MNFYISSRLRNYEQVRFAADLLKRHGWTQTCDWTHFDRSFENSPERLRSIGIQEYEGVRAADIVIILTPQGRGTHTELGMAVALEKKIYIYHEDDLYFTCNDDTCAFYWLPQVRTVTGTLENAIGVILQENGSRA